AAPQCGIPCPHHAGSPRNRARHRRRAGMALAEQGMAADPAPHHVQREIIEMSRRSFLQSAAAGATSTAAGLPSSFAQSSAIKVGILHSLSGTMAISETALKDTALMTIEEINASGGVMGRKLEPVVVDPASNWPLFAERARQLIAQDKCA